MSLSTMFATDYTPKRSRGGSLVIKKNLVTDVENSVENSIEIRCVVYEELTDIETDGRGERFTLYKTCRDIQMNISFLMSCLHDQ